MPKGNTNSPQEFQNKGRIREKMTKNIEVSLDNNDVQPDSSVISGGANPNLSPDAGKPTI